MDAAQVAGLRRSAHSLLCCFATAAHEKSPWRSPRAFLIMEGGLVGASIRKAWRGLVQATCTSAGPACICPTMAASAKPPLRKMVSTCSTVSGLHDTSKPPEVCGSVSKARWVSADVAGQTHGFPVRGPVAARGTGEDALLGQLQHAGQHRQILGVEVHGQLGTDRASSRLWPSRPKPVTSVSACTPSSLDSSAPGRLSKVVAFTMDW